MKKIIYSIAFLSAFSFAANAQENPKTKKQETVKKESKSSDEKTSTKTKTEEPKKAGTRMAINEKGLPGTKSNTKKEEKKD